MILMMKLRRDDKEIYALLQEMFGEGAWTFKMATGAGIPIKIGSLYALRNAGMITPVSKSGICMTRGSSSGYPQKWMVRKVLPK